MASGFGLNGGPSRCYPFWQELLGCYMVNSADGEEGKKKCLDAMDDYYECLHHNKEIARMKAMQIAFRRQEALHARDKAQKTEQIGPLGLLDKATKGQ